MVGMVSGGALLLLESDIQGPVQRVFYALVPLYRSQESSGKTEKARQKTPGCPSSDIADSTLGFHLNYALQGLPCQVSLQIALVLGVVHSLASPRFEPTSPHFQWYGGINAGPAQSLQPAHKQTSPLSPYRAVRGSIWESAQFAWRSRIADAPLATDREPPLVVVASSGTQ